MSGILIGTGSKQASTKQELINKFLNEWLTDKQREGMSGYVSDLLNEFGTELLLLASRVGIERLMFDHLSHQILRSTTGRVRQRHMSSLPLVILPTKDRQARRVKIDLEELNSGLDNDVKTIKLAEVNPDQTYCG